MKANKWNNLNKNENAIPPEEIREIIRIKEGYGNNDENRLKSSSKSSLINYNEEYEEKRESEKEHTPQFSLNEKAFNEISTDKNLYRNSDGFDLSKLYGYFDRVIEKVNDMETKVIKKLEIFERKIENFEKKERNKGNNLQDIWKSVDNLQERVDEIEKSIKSHKLVESSLKNLESLRFSQQKSTVSPVSLENTYAKQDQNSLRIEDSVKDLCKRIKNIEKKSNEANIERLLMGKFVGLENRLNQVEKGSDSLTGFNKNHNQTAKKLKKLEERLKLEESTIIKDHSPKVGYHSPSMFQSTGKCRVNSAAKNNSSKKLNTEMSIGEECESVILGALLERVNNSFRSSPERSISALGMQKSFSRAPSTDLKESLRLKGFMIDGGRPGSSASVFKNTYRNT